MTAISGLGNILQPQASFVSAGSANTTNSIIDGALKTTTPMVELGIMSSLKDDPTKLADLAIMGTPAGPATMAMQQLGLPPISELLKDLGVDKVLEKVPGVNLATNALGSIAEIGSKAIEKVSDVGKKAVGGIKKAVSKL